MRVLFLYLSLFSGSIAAVAQTGQSVHSLVDDLATPQKTTQAAAALLQLAEAQRSVYQELSNVLPNLMLRTTDMDVLQSEARLAGKLKLVSAIPALIKLLDLSYRWGGMLTTFGQEYDLDDDPIGRALADIGAPSVQPLSTPLESVTVATRTRAARVLIRINTPESLSLLQQHVGREADDHLKGYIAANLARTKQ